MNEQEQVVKKSLISKIFNRGIFKTFFSAIKSTFKIVSYSIVLGCLFGAIVMFSFEDQQLGVDVTIIFSTSLSMLRLFGFISYKSPKRILSLFNFCFNIIKRFKKIVISIVVLALIVAAGYYYYLSLPQPVHYKITSSGPPMTRNADILKPSPISIYFKPIITSDHIGQEVSKSVAKLELVGKTISTGITVTPELTGVWGWDNDRQLRFLPKNDWLAGQEYEVTFDESIFKPDLLLSSDTHTFKTKNFGIKLQSFRFYQDPAIKSSHKVVATFKATHPVDIESFKDKLVLHRTVLNHMSDEGTQEEYKFEVTHDKNKREIYVNSENISILDTQSRIYLKLDRGVQSIYGLSKLSRVVNSKVSIPSVSSFFKVEHTNLTLVENAKDELEQALIIKFSDEISSDDVITKTKAYLLPLKHSKNGSLKSWNSPREIDESVLERSTEIDLTAIETERDTATLHSFTFDSLENRQIYIRLESGLKSKNDFIMANIYDRILRTPSYPKEVSIMSDGVILAKNGDHKLSFVTRNAEHIMVDIAKVNANQINHLISQTDGRITSPEFKNYSFNKTNISTLSTEKINLKPTHPKKAVYSSLDLSKKYNDSIGLGLFFIEARGYNKLQGYSYDYDDKRLILITDLGILVKNSEDGTHDVFVQSIETGKPVANATVSILGKNGIAILEAKTNAKGHVSFPKTSSFRHEKAPVAFVVKHNSDVSFITYNRHSRSINYSRFNTGGISTSAQSNNEMSAFMFSDRGIYRPGDKIKLAAIVKTTNFSKLGRIPLEVNIRDPRGSVVLKKRMRLGLNGLLDINFNTEKGAVTGTYRTTVSLVNDNNHLLQLGNTSFKVEEFQPDRLKIKSEFSNYKSKGWVTDSEFKALVNLENLFGIPAQDNRVTANLRLSPTRFNFQGYERYVFSDTYYGLQSRDINLNDTRTDKKGFADFDINLKNYNEGTYKLNLSVRGYEKSGGRSVRSSSSMLVSPQSELIGYKADGGLSYITKNSKRTLTFININSDLEQAARDNLSLKLTKKQYVSTLVQANDGTYQYQSVSKDKVLKETDFAIAKKGTQFLLATETPGDYLLDVIDSEGKKLSRVYFSVIGAGNLTGKLEKNAELQLKLNKKDYKSGENIEMSIVAPYIGSGLITIETNKVHAFKWFKTDVTSSVQTIKLPEGIEGNAYINVSFVRDISSKEIFTSPLSYAVKSFSIDPSKRIVDLNLTAPKLIEPGDELTISYSSEKPSSVILYAVDEGILQVGRYQTPKPLNHFLQKRALEVSTMQIVDLILPAYGLVKEAAATGGGFSEINAIFKSKQLNPFERKVVKPVAFWSGILQAGPDVKTHTFTMPNTFSGRLRVMAVAVNDDGVGVKELNTVVRGAFVLTPSVLTAAAPGDEFDVVLGVANTIKGSGPKLPVNIDISVSDNLQIVGDIKSTLAIDEYSEDKLNFKVKVLSKLGNASITFKASSGKNSSTKTATLSVRPSMPSFVTFESGFNESGEKVLQVPRALYAELADNSITASSSPLALIDGLVSYLDSFPHQKTEQIVSAVFPILDYLEHPSYMGESTFKYARLNNVVTTLRKRQLPSGQFMAWPSSSRGSTYASLYIMHFLLDAKNEGIAVPNDMWKKGFEAVRDIANGNNKVNYRNRAYAIYLLTRKGEVTTNYLSSLEFELTQGNNTAWRKDITAVFVGATYQLMIVKDKAQSFIADYEIGEKVKNDRWGHYDSRLAHDAQYVYLLSKHFPQQLADLEKEKLFTLIEPILENKYNTMSSAWTILALSAYSEAVLPKGRIEDVTVTSFKEKEPNEELGKSLTLISDPYPKAAFSVGVKRLEILAPTDSFYMMSQSGFDNSVPKEALRSGLEITREFQDEDGNILSTIMQGEELSVVLKIRSSTGNFVPNVAIIDLLPGGFEVLTDSVRKGYNGWKSDYQDIREDRVIFYGGFGDKMTQLTYKVKATASGDFVVPPSYAESMSDLNVKAYSKSSRFNVTPSK